MSILVRIIVLGLGLALMVKAIVMGVIEGLLGIKSHDPDTSLELADWMTSCAACDPPALPSPQAEIKALAASRHADAKVVHQLRLRRAEVLPELLHSIDHKETSLDASIHAACLLIILREPRGFQLVADCLQSKNPATIVLTLETLAVLREDETEDHVVALLEWPNMANLLLQFLTAPIPEVRSAAIQACGYLRVPGAMDLFDTALGRDDAIDRGRMAYWLGRDASPQQAADILERVFRDTRDATDLYWIASGTGRLAARGDADIQRRCVSLARSVIEQTRQDDDTGMLARHELLGIVSQYATQSDASWIHALLLQLEPEEHSDLYTALIRSRAPKWRETVLAGLSDGLTAPYVASSLAAAFTGPPDPLWVEALQQQLQSAESPALVSVFCAALEAIDSEPAWQAIEQHHERAAPWDRMHLRWRLRGWQVSQLRDDIGHAFELSSAEFDQAYHVTEVSADVGEHSPSESPPALLHLLHAAGRLAEFPCEADDVPCPHDEVLRELAGLTGGAWQPSHIVQRIEPHVDPSSDNPAAAPAEDYVLQLVTNGVEYQARLRNQGEAYDFARLAQLTNHVLTDLGCRGRLIPLHSDGEYQCFVYGIPERVKAMAAEYAIPLADGA